MYRFIVPALAALAIAGPLSAQAPAKDTTKPPSPLAKPAKVDSAAGEVGKKDEALAKKDSLAPAKDSVAAAKESLAPAKDSVAPAKDPSLLTPRRPTFRCKDGTIAYVADSTQACGLRGGVDSAYKKPATP